MKSVTFTICRRMAVGVLGLLLASPAMAHADGLRPGLWRILTHPVIDGVAGQAQENTRCLSSADVADLEKTFSPVGQTVNSTCAMVEHALTPQRLKWHLQCTGQFDMDLTGDFSFDAPEHYTATVTTAAAIGGRLMQSGRMTVEGQRVGECK
jgi:hypothetical protein